MAPGNVSDAFAAVIEGAVDAGVRKALNISEATNRRLMSIADAAAYLALSTREVYNMLSTKEFPEVSRGRKKMIDIRDLDAWIDRNKSNR